MEKTVIAVDLQLPREERKFKRQPSLDNVKRVAWPWKDPETGELCSVWWDSSGKAYSCAHRPKLVWHRVTVISTILHEASTKCGRTIVRIVRTETPRMVNHGAGPTVPTVYLALFERFGAEHERSLMPITSNVHVELFHQETQMPEEKESSMIQDWLRGNWSGTNSYTRPWFPVPLSTCCICLDLPANMYLGCGRDMDNEFQSDHVVVCATCGKTLNHCPTCRRPVVERKIITGFLS